jgi:hypothetical protein
MLLNAGAAPVIEISLADYFRQRLIRYAKRLRPPPQEETCWYLGSVLDRFGRSDRLFAYEENRLTLRPLAQLYGDALEARDERERCLLLQQLGDMALFLGALFPERYARYGIHQDYFIGMGGGAYDYLADNAHRNRHIFAELASAFARMLDLVASACARTREPTTQDVLTLYRRWVHSGDPRLARRLRALGIDVSGHTRVQ